MTEIDWILITIISISAIVSLFRGLVKEVVSFISWVAALWVAKLYCVPFSAYFAELFDNSTLKLTVAFVLLFVVTLIIGGMVSILISTCVKSIGLGIPDRLMGTVFGTLRGIIAVVIGISVLQVFAHEDSWQDSVLLPYFTQIQTHFVDFIKDNADKHYYI